MKFFEIDVLAPGQIARYDLDIYGSAAVLSRKGETVEFIVEGEYIEPPTWEIFAPEAIRLNQVLKSGLVTLLYAGTSRKMPDTLSNRKNSGIRDDQQETVKGSSETTRKAPILKGEDIVRALQRCREASRNDLPAMLKGIVVTKLSTETFQRSRSLLVAIPTGNSSAKTWLYAGNSCKAGGTSLRSKNPTVRDNPQETEMGSSETICQAPLFEDEEIVRPLRRRRESGRNDLARPKGRVTNVMQERISIHVQIEEDTQFLALLDASTLANSGATQNPITVGTAGASKQLFNTLAYETQKWDLPAYAFLMHHNAYKDMREWARDDFDPVTMRQILETGLYGKLWGIDVIVSRLVSTDTIYCMSEPRFFGVMPIRYSVAALRGDAQRKNLRNCRKTSMRQSAAKPFTREGSETVMQATATNKCPVCDKSFHNRNGVGKHLHRWMKNEPSHVQFLEEELEHMLQLFHTSPLSCDQLFKDQLFWQDIRVVWRENFSSEQVEARRRKKIRETSREIYSNGTMDWLCQANSERGKRKFATGQLELTNLTSEQLAQRNIRIRQYHQNNSPTLAHRQKNSMGVKRAYAEGRKVVSPKNAHGINGVREDLGHFVRSRWEANTCHIMRLLEVEYEYEPTRFDLDDTTYCPDFYLPERDVYIEVKGGFPFELSKVERFKEKTGHTIYTIGPEEYSRLKTIFKLRISLWEPDGVAVDGTVRAAWRHAELGRNDLTVAFFAIVTKLTDLIVMPDDEPRRALIAYVGYEEIGMAIGNANGLSKVTFSGSIS